MSGNFHRLIWKLEDKYGRADCELHCGNFAGGTGLQTQVHGCTLVGRGFAWIERTDAGAPTLQKGIAASVATLNMLMECTKPADELLVTYQWAEGAAPPDDPAQT